MAISFYLSSQNTPFAVFVTAGKYAVLFPSGVEELVGNHHPFKQVIDDDGWQAGESQPVFPGSPDDKNAVKSWFQAFQFRQDPLDGCIRRRCVPRDEFYAETVRPQFAKELVIGDKGFRSLSSSAVPLGQEYREKPCVVVLHDHVRLLSWIRASFLVDQGPPANDPLRWPASRKAAPDADAFPEMTSVEAAAWGRLHGYLQAIRYNRLCSFCIGPNRLARASATAAKGALDTVSGLLAWNAGALPQTPE